MFSAPSYAAQLASLLPPGRAWSREPDSFLGRLRRGIAEELARVDGRGAQLIEEADPRTALELLEDWERMCGLPDECFGQPDNLTERRIAIAQRLTSVGGQSRAYFIELAAQLGYPVTIDEFRPTSCLMACISPVYDEQWVHVWRVNVLPLDEELPADQFWLAWANCLSACDVPLRGWGALDLECLIRRHRPAHSIVLFAYQITPTPLFWFDFTA